MLTFRSGAAGARSAAKAMAGHLTEQTLPAAERELAAYYTRGIGVSDSVGEAVRDAARQVADGTLSYSDAHDQLLGSLYADLAGEIDPVHGIPTVKAGADMDQMLAMEERLADALTDLTVFYSEGGQDERHGTRPEPRQDMHPLVAETLGLDLSRPTTEDELSNLFMGKRADGEDLAGHKREVAFIDLCWSADKSVSLAWAFAPTEAERAMILQAHRDAVDAAMAYVAKEIGIARTGKDGVKMEPAHIGWITFDHFTARPTAKIPVPDPDTGIVATELHTIKVCGDPQLHTHVAVPNVTVTDAGRVGGLFMHRLNGRVHEFGAYYQAQLATRLRAVGVDAVLDPKKGSARVWGISDRVRDEFSKRTNDAEGAARDFAKAQGLDWDELKPEARVKLLKGGANATRKSKTDDMSDFTAWKEQAAELGWRHQGAIRAGREKALDHRQTRLERAYQAALPLLEAEFARRSVLTPADVRIAATRGLVAAGIEDERDVSRVTRMFRERGITQEGRNTALVWGEDGEHGIRITTALHSEQEAEVVRLAKDAEQDRSGALTAREIAVTADASGLDFTGDHGQAQRAGMERLATGGRLGVFIAAAGAGKTSLLAPVTAAYQQKGADVHGIALAWRQADELTGAGIASESVASIARFLARAKAGSLEVGPQSVVIVDEVGLLGGRQALDLLRLREERGFTLLMVGDDRQCQSIEAAPVLGLLRQALGPDAIPEVASTIRQQTQREREIAGLLRDGQAGAALAMKREDGSLETVPGGYKDAVERVAALYVERHQANAGVRGYSLTISAPTNADARTISAAIREKRRALGEVGQDFPLRIKAQDQQGTAYDLTLAPGDRVRLFDRVFGKDEQGRTLRAGNNGSVVEVIAADEKTLTVRGKEGVVAVPWDNLRGRDRAGRVRLAYGDVLTIDAAQGITSTEHIAALPGGSRAVDGFKAYVAASRHRQRTFLVTSDGAERQEVVSRRPLGDMRPITAQDVLDNMARNLSRQEAKGTATAFLRRVREIERGAARGLQAGLRPMEARAAAGEPPPALAQAVDRHRARPVLERLAERVEMGLQARRDAKLRAGLEAAQARHFRQQGRGR